MVVLLYVNTTFKEVDAKTVAAVKYAFIIVSGQGAKNVAGQAFVNIIVKNINVKTAVAVKYVSIIA